MAAVRTAIWMRSDPDRVLPDAEIAGVAVAPTRAETPQAGERAGAVLPGGQLHSLAEMQTLTHADDRFRTDAQADRDEIGIARLLQSPPEVVRPGVGQVFESVIADSDMAFVGLGGIGFDSDDLLGVQASLQGGQPHHQLED